MGYQSFEFLVFTFVTVLLYYLLAKIFGKRVQKWVILAANMVFYVIAGLEYMPFLAATLLMSFFCARIISRVYKRGDELLKQCADAAEKKQVRTASKKQARVCMLIGILIPLAVLIVDKYTGFVLSNVNRLLAVIGLQPVTLFKFIVPLGISYYTFMAVSYVLDVYWKRTEAEKNFVFYAAFLSFFPHITQGPIQRYSRFKPQIENGVDYSSKNIVYGCQLMLLGLFKKLVIADRLGIFVSKVYDGYDQYTGLIFVVATVFYAIQIYCDFSGCMDIVGGVAEMMGITMEKNFNHPFFSKTIPEFWRRWHMTMGEWFKDYIFYPLSTSRYMKKTKKWLKGKGWKKAEDLFTTCFPVLVVWCVTGLWHNASWNYFLWGMYFAMVMVLGNVFSEINANLPVKLGWKTDTFSWRLFQMMRTFVICGIGRVMPRAPGMRAAFEIYKRTFQNVSLDLFFHGDLFKFGLNQYHMTVVLLAIMLLWGIDLMQEKMKIRDELAKQMLPFRWCVSILAVLIILIFGLYGPGYDATAFIYGRY